MTRRGLLLAGMTIRWQLLSSGGWNRQRGLIQSAPPMSFMARRGCQTVPQQDRDIVFSVPLLRRSGFEHALACLGVYEFSAAVKKLEEKGIDIKAFLSGSRLFF